MNTFTIDAHNALARVAERPPDGVENFASEKDLAKLAAKWPANRLVAIWNGMRGARKVNRFRDRKTAVRRIWNKAQELPALPATSTEVGEGTKAALVIALLREPAGATLKAVMAMTGWQAHSVRGFISAQLVKKRGLRIQSFKRGGERVYRIRP